MPSKKTPKKAHIVGFAPSWEETPWGDPDAERWGMNALHKVAGDRPFTRWFQLHDIDTHHPLDAEEHLSWLRGCGMPVVMWQEHIEKYDIKNATPYPKDAIVKMFGRYFTNTVSWMIALAIYEGYSEIGIYGVDMAQDSEYGHQRPSCEYFLGWAKGKGINIEIPQTSDLLKAPYLYGLEDGGPMRVKFETRLKELTSRRDKNQQQMNRLQAEILTLNGAIEDTRYYLRAWSIEGGPALDGQSIPSEVPEPDLIGA